MIKHDWMITGALLAVLLVAMLSIRCAENLTKLPEQAPNPPHTIRTLAGDIMITIYEIDGCQYLVRGECIIHKANCPNHNYTYISGEPKQ